MLNVIIVDDEPMARENLRYLLAQDSQVAIVKECANAIEAISAIHKHHPDVVFLDIQMPKISGIEMVSMIDPQYLPYIVFITAYDEYAIKAFEEQAFDYLLKPIDHIRLNKTLARLHNNRPPQDVSKLEHESEPLKYIPCAGHSRIYLLNIEDVFYVSSRVSGIYVFSQDNTEYYTELTLRTLEERTALIRCHRQYLINMAQLKELRFNPSGQTEIILKNNVAVPVSRRYLKPLKERLGLYQ